ncbi:unnamed protein product [Psylliodes chrysocephalus]|uniref:Uncharacterized protein n=1 Tax=Psylliodes chrysocephalus TaxID=3402493 RepID=A0A9P0CWN4_9CUCU|nr:unnamed protein product [Psylliodes chrysocephala]
MTLYRNKKTIRELFNNTKDTFWTPSETKNIKRSQKLGTFLKNFYFKCVVLCITSTVIKPFVLGEGASSYTKYKPDYVPRYFFLILEDIACTAALLSMLCLDVVILTLLMMTEVQFQILNNKLSNLFHFDSGKEVYYQQVLHKRIKEYVDHQNFLIKFLARFSRIFSVTTLFFLGDIILTMCMRMYIISSDNTHINYRIEALFHLIAGLNEIIFCYSIPAQALMDQANEISNSAYLSNWYEYPADAKCILQIMIRDQKKIEITAGGYVMIDLKMFMAVRILSF